MSEKDSFQTSEFLRIISESHPEDPIDEHRIYTRLRNTFSPQEIAELLVESDFPEETISRVVIEDLYAQAKKEIPFDEAHSKDLLIKELAPFYDKVGDIALHLSVAFATMEIAGRFLRDIDFASNFANEIQSILFDHVGNAQNSFAVVLAFGAVKLAEKAVADHKITIPDILALKKIIETVADIGKILLPYMLISIMLGYQIDTETAQILPGSFGTPDLKDIPVGLISIIGLAKVLEMQRYRRPFFRPLLDRLSKAQSNTKALLPLFRAAQLNNFVVPGYAKIWVDKEQIREKKPIKHSPISFIRSLFKGKEPTPQIDND